MPDIAKVLRTEIARLARKEVRAEIGALKKAAAAHRSEIAALRRRVQQLEVALRRLPRAPAAPSGDDAGDAEGAALRFSAKGMASNRRRLGLSAEEFGRLVGVSAQSIYKWEEGAVRPRAKHLPLIAALRTIGKKEALARLAPAATK